MCGLLLAGGCGGSVATNGPVDASLGATAIDASIDAVADGSDGGAGRTPDAGCACMTDASVALQEKHHGKAAPMPRHPADAHADAPADAFADAGSDVISCVPHTCADFPQGTCGVLGDGCGGMTPNCGSCTAPEYCGGGGFALCGGGGPTTCDEDLCVPLTCTEFECGPAGDGCGGLLECGDCPSPETCSENECIAPVDAGPCMPSTCQDLGYDCGAASDGCGGHLQCGSCSGSQFCGGGGVRRCGGNCEVPEGGCQVVCTPDDVGMDAPAGG